MTSLRLCRRAVLLGTTVGLSGLAMPFIGRADSPLRIAYANAFPPVSFLDGGVMKGVLIDAFDELLVKQLGVQVTHVGMPWARAQEMVKEGTADAFCTNPTEQRTQYARFASEPVIAMAYAVFYATNNPRLADIKRIGSIDDLRGFVQGDYLGNSFAETNFKSLKIDWAANVDQLFSKISAGRNDVAVISEMVGKWTVRKLSLAGQIGSTPENFTPTSRSILGIRKSYENGDDLLRQVDEVVRAARASGLLKQIEARYT